MKAGASGGEFFKRFAQMLAGTVDPGFYRADAGIETLSDLIVAEALLLEQENGGAVVFRKCGEGAVKGLFNFPAMIGGLGLALHQKLAWIDVFEWAAGFFAVAVDETAPGEGKDEGAKGTSCLIAGGRAVQFDEGLLGEVFGISAVPRGSVEEVNEPYLPAVNDLGEGGRITLS